MWRDMNMSMNGMEPSWTAVNALLLFVMWSAMMAAMMVPGASPMVSAFATINRRRRQRSAPYVPTAVFLLGYLIVWAGFFDRSDSAAMGVAVHWPAHHHDAVDVALLVGSAVPCRRPLPIQPFEREVSRLLPDTRQLHSERMARRRARGRCHGPATRVVLPRLLRSPHGAAVRRRGHGSTLGRSFDRSCDRREAPAWREILAYCHWYRLADSGPRLRVCRLEGWVTFGSRWEQASTNQSARQIACPKAVEREWCWFGMHHFWSCIIFITPRRRWLLRSKQFG